MNTPDTPRFRQKPSPFEMGERTRLGVQGELSFHAGSLIQYLRSNHRITQLDRILEFPAPGLLPPDEFTSSYIDSVKVILGELNTQKGHETHISLRITAGDDTLVVHRSSELGEDPNETRDYIEHSTGIDQSITISYLNEDISQKEFNSLLVGLVANDAERLDEFEGIDFLSDPLFLALYDELEEAATHKEVSGIHSFNDDDSELEFEQIDQRESFKLTHTTHENQTPRSVAASASSSVNFMMQFFVAVGRDVSSVIPDIEDVELLKDVALAELISQQKQVREQAGNKFRHAGVSEDELTFNPEADINRIDTDVDTSIGLQKAADQLGFDELLGGEQPL
jgi:hypothetical protein